MRGIQRFLLSYAVWQPLNGIPRHRFCEGNTIAGIEVSAMRMALAALERQPPMANFVKGSTKGLGRSGMAPRYQETRMALHSLAGTSRGVITLISLTGADLGTDRIAFSFGGSRRARHR